MLITDLPSAVIAQRLPEGWSAYLGPDGDVLLWDGRNHASAGKRGRLNVGEAVRQLKAHRSWEDAGKPPFRLADYL